MSIFNIKQYNTATQIEKFIKSLNRIPYNFEQILETNPNEFNIEKLCKYINSEHFKNIKVKSVTFCRRHISTDGCIKIDRKIMVNSNNSGCLQDGMNSAKIVFSIYELMNRIKNDENEGMPHESVNLFFKGKFDKIKELNSDFNTNEFEQTIGKVDCDYPNSSFF